ncbi:MAG: pyridoxamine 5'-phosphate oxidase [Flavobacteriales bacterium]|nr:pyridoxamine 5'-phosphate oxidase [Flavobacteriales bacterium]
MDLRNQRTDYSKGILSEENAGNNPFDLFRNWFENANQTEAEANAMVLSTIFENQPHSRIVLLKELIDDTFVFYTNYLSDKGKAITQNNNVSLLFFWQQNQQQVRIEGIAEKVSSSTSDEYFYSRPIESQIGAIASMQSSVLTNREWLEKKVEELSEYYKTHKIIRPEHWGGYAVFPSKIEFWQGRSSRLHDRIVFEKINNEWSKKRLSP